MGSFRFIHAADLHLGSPFKGLAVRDADVAGRFAAATREALRNLVERAIAERVDFVVLAGDLYDGEWKDASVGLYFNREMARLDRAGIRVFTLRGNHDALSEVTRSITLPASVREFPTDRPETIHVEELGVVLHGHGFAERSVPDNLARGYPDNVQGAFNIGVLHTSLTGRPGHDDYAPCTVEDLVGRGYDYWALGHVHAHEVVSEAPHIVFPGNLQGRSVRECGAKGAVVVTVAHGEVVALERFACDCARWADVSVDVAGCPDVPAVLRAVEEAAAAEAQAAEGRLLALRLRLHGQPERRGELLAGRAALRDELQAALHRLGEDVWLEKLVLELAPEEARPPEGSLDVGPVLAALSAEPALRAEAAALIEQIDAKLPRGVPDPLSADEVETLLMEAASLAAARAEA